MKNYTITVNGNVYDVTVDEGDIDTRFMSLLNCINTRAKYEVNRLR